MDFQNGGSVCFLWSSNWNVTNKGFRLKWLGPGLSPRRPGLNPSPLHVVHVVALRVMLFSSVSVSVQVLNAHPSVCLRFCTNVAAGSIVGCHTSACYSSLIHLFRVVELAEKLYKHESVFKNAYFWGRHCRCL
jgi:hypothetical protein